jgi:hypothetical protein
MDVSVDGEAVALEETAGLVVFLAKVKLALTAPGLSSEIETTGWRSNASSSVVKRVTGWASNWIC